MGEKDGHTEQGSGLDMSTSLGPFAVEPDQIVRLGSSFTVFINRLLDTEHAAAGQAGIQLRTNYWENVGDGGVDAYIRGASGSRWLPDGDSAWQFKRGDLAPQECRNELSGRRHRSEQPASTWARDLIAGGAKYRLVLGVALTPQKIANRTKALYAEAQALGLSTAEGTYEVLDANMLARWSEEYPSLAVSPLLRGPGQLATDFKTWSDSNRHTSRWVATPERNELMENLRTAASNQSAPDIRVDGVSGLGKTRFVMEALRGTPLECLVAYIGDAEKLGPELVNHLLAHRRSAVVVVDECTARRHEKVAEAIPIDSRVKLLTIGEPDSYHIRAPLLRLDGLSEDALDSILKENWPELWSEARRFITTQSDGNVRLALLLGENILRAPLASANELIQGSDISGLLTNFLSGGGDFLAASILALCRRVGWDGDLGYQVERLADSTGVSLEQLRNVGFVLEQQGLLVRQGRYRAVSPHPVAIFLATRAWRELSDRLVRDLVPHLDGEFAYSFFSRAADLGEFEPTHTAIARLLESDGPFSSLDTIESRGTGRVLTQIAIVAPDETSLHLTQLIQDSTTDHLEGLRQSRRDLVWTLEKLAWHSRTFDEAADNLLKLALAENETWSNNATGTWVNLFGTMLPGTAAKPRQRLDYLQRVAANTDVRTKRLLVEAAARALSQHEFIQVSGELQAGVLVEPRGTPATYAEAFEYQSAIISLLASLLRDADAEVVEDAESTLIGAIHPSLEIPAVLEPLIDGLLQMRPEGLQKVRKETEHLSALFERVDDVDGRIQGLRALTDRLPSVTNLEELDVLVQLNRWDFSEGELQARIQAAVQALPEAGQERALELLRSNVPASWELGRAVAVAWGRSDERMQALADNASASLPALVGYLWGVHEQGSPEAFDDFLEGPIGATLPPELRVAIAVRGPAMGRGIERVLSELSELTPAEGAAALFGWHRSLSGQQALRLFGDWTDRIESQGDYNAVVGFAGMVLHNADETWDLLRDTVYRLVMMRQRFPGVGREERAWARLAERFLPGHAVEICKLYLDSIEAGDFTMHEGSEDSALLLRCAAAEPIEVWGEVSRRLEAGSWRVELSLRWWLIGSIPAEVIDSWIGSDVGRARIAASVTSVGGDETTQLARTLLARFGTDDEITSSLAGAFISGSWLGNESDRIAAQIDQLRGWVSRASEPQGVRAWARRMIRSLEIRRSQALQREAERD